MTQFSSVHQITADKSSGSRLFAAVEQNDLYCCVSCWCLLGKGNFNLRLTSINPSKAKSCLK